MKWAVFILFLSFNLSASESSPPKNDHDCFDKCFRPCNSVEQNSTVCCGCFNRISGHHSEVTWGCCNHISADHAKASCNCCSSLAGRESESCCSVFTSTHASKAKIHYGCFNRAISQDAKVTYGCLNLAAGDSSVGLCCNFNHSNQTNIDYNACSLLGPKTAFRGEYCCCCCTIGSHDYESDACCLANMYQRRLLGYSLNSLICGPGEYVQAPPCPQME